MIQEDDFTISLVSNGSMDLFPNNKLSTFTNRLASKCLLSRKFNWSVGLTRLAHSSIKQEDPSNPQIQTTLHDEVVFTSTSASAFRQPMREDEFIKLISVWLIDPYIYNEKYFERFSNAKKFKFSDERTMTLPAPTSSTPNPPEPTEGSFLVRIFLKNLYGGSSSTPQKYADPIVEFFYGYKYTLSMIFEKLLAAIYKEFYGFETLASLMKKAKIDAKAAKLFEAARDKIIQTSITYFIKITNEELKTFEKLHVSDNFYEFVYIDIIEPRFLSDSLNRVIFIKNKIFNIPINESPTNIQYYKLNTYELTNINVAICDENANLLNLEAGYFNTHLDLHFKKTLKDI